MPFSDESWTALDALGDRVDADLTAHDVRLTMGGEPTFVSIDDYQSDEWNTDALGPSKRLRADELIRRCTTVSRPAGCCTNGEGKWYPGEPLPRWAFSLFWRRDGVPLWRQLGLLATEASMRVRPTTRRGASLKAWRRGSALRPVSSSPLSRIRPIA